MFYSIKIAELDKIYNFVVECFYITGHLDFSNEFGRRKVLYQSCRTVVVDEFSI